MMTREEAITLFEKQLTAAKVVLDGGFGSNPGENDFLYRRRKDMAEIALSALRSVSREQVEKVWRGEWIDKPTGRYGQRQSWCSACEKHSGIGGIKSNQHKTFCPNCGAPMTDEAVEMVMERLEALKDGL